MIQARTIVARCLVVLALIVQIVAPTAASVAMVVAATDPLAAVAVCGHDETPSGALPTADACRLCDLVCHGGGFAAMPTAPVVAAPATLAVDVVRASTRTDLDVGVSSAAFLARGPPQNA